MVRRQGFSVDLISSLAHLCLFKKWEKGLLWTLVLGCVETWHTIPLVSCKSFKSLIYVRFTECMLHVTSSQWENNFHEYFRNQSQDCRVNLRWLHNTSAFQACDILSRQSCWCRQTLTASREGRTSLWVNHCPLSAHHHLCRNYIRNWRLHTSYLSHMRIYMELNRPHPSTSFSFRDVTPTSHTCPHCKGGLCVDTRTW